MNLEDLDYFLDLWVKETICKNCKCKIIMLASLHRLVTKKPNENSQISFLAKKQNKTITYFLMKVCCQFLLHFQMDFLSLSLFQVWPLHLLILYQKSHPQILLIKTWINNFQACYGKNVCMYSLFIFFFSSLSIYLHLHCLCL